MATAACFVAGAVAPGAALEALLAKEPLSLATIDLVCCEAPAQQQGQPSSSKYTVALSASSSPHSRESLARVARSMAPGGRLYVYESAQPSSSTAESGAGASRLDALKRDLLLSGFTDASELSSSGASASTGAAPAVWVTAQLPSWGLGAAAKLSLKRPAAAPSATGVPPAAPPAAAPAPAATWKLGSLGGGMEGDGDEDELVDEEALLGPEDKAPPAAPKPDDCEVGSSGRKACKNCSCGRAEAEAAGGVKLTADMLDNPTSACGNCYLGDAFRCGSCPYRGLPAFEPGQKISLAATGLAADL